ncbi:CHASE3 domain-containing protein [Paenibacillus eucommiae]|uniref:histidine kinase n=1 Tax=Paenibacillus eucommiae TaxID=1355755 RepID=A0ABS4IQT0_9BACL|nr:CHASE3 domain-containing protein [Paenibacillus eucommiae]MBP1988964.1 two-component system chemotaxis sensor kinase CheA [Paenibacillus eucommiae]
MLKNTRFNIRTKIMLGYIIIIICLGVSVLLVTQRISDMQKEIDFITSHDLEVHNLTNRIEKHLLDMETGQRGYLITGDSKYLEPYNSGRNEWVQDFNRLVGLLTDNQSQLQKLGDIKVIIERWISTAGEPTIEWKRDGKTEEILNYFKTDVGKENMDQMRAEFESFRTIEKQLTNDRAALLASKNNVLKLQLFIILLVISLLAIVAAQFISGSIVRTISQVIKTIKGIASSSGANAERIQVTSNDEIKDLSDAANELLDNHEEQFWLQSRIAEMAVTSHGVNDVKELAQLFISKFASMLNSSYGAFYLRVGTGEQQKLVRAASFAADGEARGNSSFLIGQGLVGQAALEKRMIYLDSVPQDYVKITSGLGEASPKSIVIAPIQYDGTVEAVIELASFELFTLAHRKLLQNTIDSFGIAINNVTSRMEVERLLKESQELTEKLQTQSEELQAQTEELQAQTEELQAQAEELQVQQEELRTSNEQLEEQNQYALQKAHELEGTKKELEIFAEELQKNSAFKSEFLANMSHELRTPLNSVIILSQMLYENKRGTLSPEEEEYSRVIYAAGHDLLALIDDILDLSKVEAGKIDIVVDEVNISELPQMLSYNFIQIAEKKGISFEFILGSGVPDTIHTDSRRLQQILKNLLSNAFKFTERGNVTLQIQKADQATVNRLFPSRSSDYVLAISVEDTGIGIPQDKQNLIFEAFQQVDGTTNRRYGGTGLGLSICREFSRLLGGIIELSSQINKGSTFTLYLPSMKKGAIESAEKEIAITNSSWSPSSESFHEKVSIPEKLKASSEPVLFKGKKVLLVDDDIRNVFALTIALENEGMTVKVASNGKEGLELLEEERDIDLILMDIMMPIMDGYEAMKIIRNKLQYKELPIIALTAKAMKNDREKCLEAGASDYISKPLQIDQLFSLLRVWLTY